MLEHHVNKFGPRRRTEGCLLLIFGLRAASKESTTRRDAAREMPSLAFRQHDVWLTREDRHRRETTSQRSPLRSQMRNRSLHFSLSLSRSRSVCRASQNCFPEENERRRAESDIGWRNIVRRLARAGRGEIARGYAPFTRIKIKRDVVSRSVFVFLFIGTSRSSRLPGRKTRLGRLCVCAVKNRARNDSLIWLGLLSVTPTI